MADYTTQPGDSFRSVSIKSYGVGTESGRLQGANPGVTEPLTPGTVLKIPVVPDAPKDKTQSAAADGINEVAVLIDGVRYRFWETVSVTRSIDSVDVVNFSTPFEPNAPGFKETFRPFAFHPLTVTVGGETLFTGTLVNPSPAIGPNRRILSVSGYALPGVLNDCNAPSSAFPLEFYDTDLKTIAGSLCKPFGIAIKFTESPGPIFESVECGPQEKILSFLAGLAQQRGFIINSTETGALRFEKSVSAGSPVGSLREGQSPLLTVTPTFSPQNFFSHVTGIESALVGVEGGQFTVPVPIASGTVRPYTFTVPDALDADLNAATEAKAGRMVAGAASYQISVSTWRDPAGNLWAPNTTLKLFSPGAMVYNDYEFLVRSVTFNRAPDGETAELTLVLPGAFSGEIPEALPWD